MALLDLLGRRWTLRVLWELRGPRATFRALREACGNPSPTVLNERLKGLRDAHLVDLDDDGYGLTELGRELFQRFMPVAEWSERWAKRVRE